MSLWPWPPRLGRQHRGTSAPLLRGQCRLAWLPWGVALAGRLVRPSPAGRSQRRKVSSAPGKAKPNTASAQAFQLGGAQAEWIRTVAAPLTCTDLLAMDRVPGTRSTDNGASFCFVSVAMTSLKEETGCSSSRGNTRLC